MIAAKGKSTHATMGWDRPLCLWKLNHYLPRTYNSHLPASVSGTPLDCIQKHFRLLSFKTVPNYVPSRFGTKHMIWEPNILLLFPHISSISQTRYVTYCIVRYILHLSYSLNDPVGTLPHFAQVQHNARQISTHPR